MATIKTGMLSNTINGIKINSSIPCHSSNYTNNSSRAVNYVVMHYTGNVSDVAKSNATYFSGANRSASAHFFVDNTAIYQSVELRDAAWHCGASSYKHTSCRNANSIGIEMCCTAGNYKISDTTKKNAAYLCAYICGLVGITAKTVDTYVVRHYDVTGKTCPAQMSGDNNAEWTAFKTMVKNILSGSSTSSTTSSSTSTTNLYRIRKSWDDAASQIGAYSSLENAKKDWKSGYYIYDSNGKQVYPEATSSTTSTTTCDIADCDVDMPVLQKGCTGTGVKVLQAILGVDADGTFGTKTETALKEYQNSHSLTADGICGAKSWQSLIYRVKTTTYK